MTGCVIVTCPAGSRENASTIADALVERRLAACVQIMPVESVYRWDGALRCEPELLLQIKTLAIRFAELEAVIRTLHDYELPEIAAVPVTAASAEYARWIADSVSAPAG